MYKSNRIDARIDGYTACTLYTENLLVDNRYFKIRCIVDCTDSGWHVYQLACLATVIPSNGGRLRVTLFFIHTGAG